MPVFFFDLTLYPEGDTPGYCARPFRVAVQHPFVEYEWQLPS